MDRILRRMFSIVGLIALLGGAFASLAPAAPVMADHTTNPTTVTLVGDLQSELGCPGDWNTECTQSQLDYDTADDVWQRVFTVPAGDWNYKAAINGSWDENYGRNAAPNGSNIPLSLGADTAVKFYYDHKTHWITDNVNSVIATAAGDFQSELGCPGDWSPDCLRSWLQDTNADGIYTFQTSAIPAGSYEFKVALDEKWDVSYGGPDGNNIPFNVSTGEYVTFSYNAATHAVGVVIESAPPVDLPTVTLVGNLQSELGCAGDWDPTCEATQLTHDPSDGVWQRAWTVPAGNYEYKVALDNDWAENYGQNAQFNGANIPLSLGADTAVKFYYSHETHWITDNVNSVIATAAGDFQSEIGCPGDWSPDCLRSWLQDPDGDGIYIFETTAIPPGNYEAKIALNESWDVSYGTQTGDNIPFSVTEGARVVFAFNGANNVPAISVYTQPASAEDAALAADPVRTGAAEEVFYFAMTDRFANGDPSNDRGGSSSSDPLVHGYLPTDKGYYHGGDVAGLMGKLDYLDGLGVTALWLSPPFTNRWVQGDGTINGSSAGYHGYWQVDFTTIDPHFGSNAEMKALVDAAHARGMKVFFDVILNHTADVITYQEGQFSYRSKADYPYRDASGAAFDDRDYAGTDTFPTLDPAVSFPYTPVFADPADATAKTPAWLNNPIYYHNRGDSTFSGENSLYGDFFGLDDLFTEHPEVVTGLIDIHKNIVSEFKVDGFRVDTVKHVNDELWEAFVPAIIAHAADQGIPEFFLFGEVYDGDPAYVSRYSTSLPFPALLDFPFDGRSKSFASTAAATNNLRDLFASDDYYTDSDSNVYQIVKFSGNHDIGRLGHEIDKNNPGAPDANRVARMTLAYGLMFTTRGAPLIYYGDEQGFTGDGGDKDARQDMFPSQVASYNDDNLIGTSKTTADDNFDPTHPLYQTFSDLAALRSAYPALAQGAQIHRYSEGSAGTYAFSRIDRDEKVEYLVVLNNSESADSATFRTSSPGATFSVLYPTGASGLTAGLDGTVTTSLPGLSMAVYQASAPVPAADAPPAVVLTAPAAGAQVSGRFEVAAWVGTDAFSEVTFAVSVDGGAYQNAGVDDNAPYRLFFDPSAYPADTSLAFKAVLRDLYGNVSASNVITVTVVEPEEPPTPTDSPLYAVFHYYRPDGDYGDHTSPDFNDYWGLHLWEDINDSIDWTSPKPFLGEDEYGRFAWVRLNPGATNVGFIVHKGNTKDGTDADRFFNPSATPEIWLKAGDPLHYTSQAAAQGYATIHYHNPDGDYADWGLHLWGDAIDPSEGTDWNSPKPATGSDDFGLYWDVALSDVSQALNFIIHRGDEKDPGPDQSFIPEQSASVWIMSGDETIYTQKGAAMGFATLHYHRPDGNYGDYSSSDFNDFWGLHTWGDASDPGWTSPRKPARMTIFGPAFEVPLNPNPTALNYIFHRGDQKDPGPDQTLNLAAFGYEVWQLSGADPEKPYLLPIMTGSGSNPGNLNEQRAYWLNENTIAWGAATSGANTYRLYYAPDGGMFAGSEGISGGDFLTLTLDPAGLPADVKAKFPHLAALPALKISGSDLGMVPEILKGQIAVSALTPDGKAADASGLQIPGVLDDLYTYTGDLGVVWDGAVPTIRVWAPTAKEVKLHRFADASTTSSSTHDMTLDPVTGVWSVSGAADWKNQYYLFEVTVYVNSTYKVEHNMVTDPYSLSLSMNSKRSQIVDLRDAALKPTGWDGLTKPAAGAPEDISIYELHVRDFSAFDPDVPEELKGTFKAFTLPESSGVNHLKALAQAGLTHLHLLPVFDIATINENKAEWQTPDPAVLATYPPDSTQQQAAIAAVADLDAYNWGYDPFHYTVPEGSYSTNPDGATRLVEFREMVQSLNDMGLRVVMDVVYNHTNSSGQAEKSVLDRIVPGYYHRLNDRGGVETSTCCANTASEHNMMEKLMIDSLVTWAKEYKVDAFRFDLMGHHMKQNMLNVRAALDALTLEKDGVDGKAIYLYGEGWNFGEVANNARGVNATQFNMAGTGIGVFNDRMRDAVRGIGPFDGGEDLLRKQGFANGSYYDTKDSVPGSNAQKLASLLLQSDQVRVGMTGNLANYQFIDRFGFMVTGKQIDYNGSPAGYTLDPQEDIGYVSKHDNQTLYDINVYAAPQATSLEDRVRIQTVGLSTVLLGQGVPFVHAGSELLRSKSLDRDSYNSGDWFNKIDYTYQTNNFGVGLPPAGPNASNWSIMQPFLADPSLKAGPEQITQMNRMFQELLQIRYSSPLFRLQTAEEVQARLTFLNTGPTQLPGLIVIDLSDEVGTDIDKNFERVVVLINANDEAQTFTAAEMAGKKLALHPVLRTSADPLVKTSTFNRPSGAFTIPGRTTAVFVEYEHPGARIGHLISDVRALRTAGVLNAGQTNSLVSKLDSAMKAINKDQDKTAVNSLNAFVQQVSDFANTGVLPLDTAQRLIEAARDIIWQIENKL
jgi:pullulanase-type alpha-1,6-glucosidase